MKTNTQISFINRVNRSQVWVLIAVMALMFTLSDDAAAQKRAVRTTTDTSDAALVKRLPGFENGYAKVNGIKMHYVTGGTGTPLVLLPGYPQTWWEFNKIMPALAKQHRVIAVDLRGMGGSEKPAAGYDKKTMAKDIYELVRQLGYEKVNVAGHDIGSMVAFSFAANYPEATVKLAMLDIPHPDETFSDLRLLPEPGKFGEKIDDEHPGYPWWFAFHQVKGLPERILEGRFDIYQDFLFDYLLKDSKSIGRSDRAVYHAAYASTDAIRAGNAWYQTFPQDIFDSKTYKKLEMPVLALGAPGYNWLQASIPLKASNFRVEKIENSGHFMQEEQPEVVSRLLLEFFK